jgi:glycosyltransferase involved in cell wall biosynthesis
MRLLIVVPRQELATGNRVTATRLQRGLTARGHTVVVVETDGDAAALREATKAASAELALLLHAWRSGAPWLETGCPLPFAVLLTGTDVNIGLHDPQQAPLITAVLHQAAAVLSQNRLTVTALRRSHPQLAAKIRHLPAGITLGKTPYRLRARLAVAAGERVLLCPAGIRPVKGVLELFDLIDPLIKEGHCLHLALCGPILDPGYGERVLAAVASRPWATYLGTVPPEAMPSAMREADIIVSNSASEGLPNALVEAATLGRPIVARAIPGNAAVVTDGGNGLLFADADAFRAAIRRLADEPGLCAALSRPDPERFSPERETTVLEEVCGALLAGAGTLRAHSC